MREAVPLELQCFEKYGAEDARAFFNVNTPQDLQQAATALGGTIAQETGEKFAEIPDRARICGLLGILCTISCKSFSRPSVKRLILPSLVFSDEEDNVFKQIFQTVYQR